MEDEPSRSTEPSWLDPRNDRKTPYSVAELDSLTDDQIAMLADTPGWQNLVAGVGTERAGKLCKSASQAEIRTAWSSGSPAALRTDSGSEASLAAMPRHIE